MGFFLLRLDYKFGFFFLLWVLFYSCISIDILEIMIDEVGIRNDGVGMEIVLMI